MANGVIFRGISFPFRRGSTSFPAAATDDDLIRESLLQLVLTRRGDRVMRPDVGSNALAFVFEPNNPQLADLLRAEIQSLVARFEPRIVLEDVRVDQSGSDVLVTIDYIISATRRAGSASLSVPVPIS